MIILGLSEIGRSRHRVPPDKIVVEGDVAKRFGRQRDCTSDDLIKDFATE